MLDLSVAIKAILITMFTTFFISIFVRIIREKKYNTIMDLGMKSIVIYILALVTPILAPVYIFKRDKKELIYMFSGTKNVKSKEYKKYSKMVSSKRFIIKLGIWMSYRCLKDIHNIIDSLIQSMEVEKVKRKEENGFFTVIYEFLKSMIMKALALNFDKRLLRHG